MTASARSVGSSEIFNAIVKRNLSAGRLVRIPTFRLGEWVNLLSRMGPPKTLTGLEDLNPEAARLVKIGDAMRLEILGDLR